MLDNEIGLFTVDITLSLIKSKNMYRYFNLVSTRWTFSISISIGLERRDPQA